MKNPIILNTNGVSRFTDFVSQFPPILREEPDVVEFLSMMSDYLNNAYRDTHSVTTYTMEMVTTDSRKEFAKVKFEALRELFTNAANSGVPVLYITDSAVDPLNPLFITRTVKMSLIEDTKVISFVFSGDSSKDIGVGDAVIGENIPADSIVLSKSGNTITLNNAVTGSGYEFLTFTSAENDFDDIIQFDVISVGDMQEIRVKKDISSGIDYIKIYFEVDIRDIIGTIESIDSRYDFTGYSSGVVEHLDNTTQSGDIKFRASGRSVNTVNSVQHNNGASLLALDSTALGDISCGDRVISEYIPEWSYVTSVGYNGVTISNPVTSDGIGSVVFYPENSIIPSDDEIHVLPDPGIGKFVKKYELSNSAIDDARGFEYGNYSLSSDASNYITVLNYKGIYNSVAQSLTFTGRDISGIYFSGDSVNMLLTREDGSQSVLTSIIDTVDVVSGNSYVTFSELFDIDIDNDVDTIEFINKFGEFYSVDDLIKLDGIDVMINRILEYDIDGNVIDESDSDSTVVSRVELELNRDVDSSGSLCTYEYHLVLNVSSDISEGDYIELKPVAIPSDVTMVTHNADMEIINSFSSLSGDVYPYRYIYSELGSSWEWLDYGDGSLETELIHFLPESSREIILTGNNARAGDILTVHTDIERSQNISVYSSGIDIDNNMINVRQSIPNNTVIGFNNETNLPSPFNTGYDYYVVNSSGTNIQLSTTIGGSPVDITSLGIGTQSLSISYVIQYMNDSGDTLVELRSSSKRKTYTNIYSYTDSWKFTKCGNDLSDGSGIFYSRDMTNVNVAEKYLNVNNEPIFRDSETYATSDNWRGKFIIGSNYSADDIVGVGNGDMYRAIADISRASLNPMNDSEKWSLIEISVFSESDAGLANPYIYGPINTQTISDTDVIKSNYSVSCDVTGKILTTGSDVRNIIRAGDSINVKYTELGTVSTHAMTVAQTVFHSNTSETEIVIANASDVSETITSVDINANGVLVSNVDIWSYGQRVVFSSTSDLPGGLESTGIYYIVSSQVSGNMKLVTVTDEYGSNSEIDISTSGSGMLTITAESAIPPDASDIYIEFSDILDKFFISKTHEQVFDIQATQRAWLFNPTSAPDSAYTRNGWLTTISQDFDASTTEFYCRRNLFNSEDTELGYFTGSTGEIEPAWYKYSINLLENIQTTNYSSTSIGYDAVLRYVDNTISNEITVVSRDLIGKYSSATDSVTNVVKLNMDGERVRELPIRSISLSGNDTVIKLGKSGLTSSDVDIVDNTIDVGSSIEVGQEIIFDGIDTPFNSASEYSDIYYVVYSEGNYIKISATDGGDVIDLVIGTSEFGIKYNVISPLNVDITTTEGSASVVIDGVFDFTAISGGDSVIAISDVGNTIFPDGTTIRSIDAVSGKLVLSNTARESINMSISIVSSIDGKLFYPDKTSLRISQLEIEIDPSKYDTGLFDDNERYALYASTDISDNIPSTLFLLPTSPAILRSGVTDIGNGEYASFDVVDAASEELIDSFFEFEHIDNIDTTNLPAMEYDYRRDDNTHILAKDSAGDYIHANVNMSKDFAGVTDQKYSLVEKIERLAYQKDPNVIDIDLIEYLARYMGYDITVLKDDLDSSPIYDTAAEREMALRKTIQNLPEYHAIKSTESGLRAMLLTFGIVGRVIKLWSVKSDPYLGRWFSDDDVPAFVKLNVGGNKSLDPSVKTTAGGPVELVPTPHFKLEVDVEPDDPDLTPTNVDLSRVKLSIIRNKPINTVFDGIVAQLEFIHEEFISRPSFKNKVKMSFSAGFDMTDLDRSIYTFNEL